MSSADTNLADDAQQAQLTNGDYIDGHNVTLRDVHDRHATGEEDYELVLDSRDLNTVVLVDGDTIVLANESGRNYYVLAAGDTIEPTDIDAHPEYDTDQQKMDEWLEQDPGLLTDVVRGSLTQGSMAMYVEGVSAGRVTLYDQYEGDQFSVDFDLL